MYIYLMKMEFKIDQNGDYFSENFEMQFQIQNLKLPLLFIENFTVRFSDFFYLKKKKLSGQIVLDTISISTYKSQCFTEIYDFMPGRIHCNAGPHAAHRLDSPRLDYNF